MPTARIVRGVVLSLKEKEFVEAARALGASDKRIIFRHLLPNSMGPIIVTVTLNVAAAILTESALSFLGFGVNPPVPTWGNLLADGKGYFSIAPWLVWFPGLTVVIVVLGVNFMGDGCGRLRPRRGRSAMSTTAAEPTGAPRGGWIGASSRSTTCTSRSRPPTDRSTRSAASTPRCPKGDRRHRRRVGIGQVGDDARADGTAPEDRDDHRFGEVPRGRAPRARPRTRSATTTVRRSP